MNNMMFLGAKSCGKSTIIDALHKLLSEKGYSVALFDGHEASQEAIAQLLYKHDCIILEGADLANMRIADMADASVVLVGDIEIGGVFAVLYGAYALLKGQRISGFLINKFRGERKILELGLKFLEEKTGVPVLGIIPYTSTEFIGVFRASVDLDAISKILGADL